MRSDASERNVPLRLTAHRLAAGRATSDRSAALLSAASSIRVAHTRHASELPTAERVEIDVADGPTLAARRNYHTFEGMIILIAALTWSPTAALKFWYSEGGWTESNINDPDYDAMYDAALATDSPEELQKLAKELDMYAIERH